jgi:Glyoxalase-like domain
MVWCQPARSPSWQDSGMERALGIGGYFIRAADPAALGAWYRDCLGLDADENGLWRHGAGPTVFATFESGTGYFGSRAQQTMLNFRVRDLDAMLAQLRAGGADVGRGTQARTVSAGSAGSPILRATGSSCGSPPDRVITQAVTCLWPARYCQAAEVRPPRCTRTPAPRSPRSWACGRMPRQAAAEISPDPDPCEGGSPTVGADQCPPVGRNRCRPGSAGASCKVLEFTRPGPDVAGMDAVTVHQQEAARPGGRAGIPVTQTTPALLDACASSGRGARRTLAHAGAREKT